MRCRCAATSDFLRLWSSGGVVRRFFELRDTQRRMQVLFGLSASSPRCLSRLSDPMFTSALQNHPLMLRDTVKISLTSPSSIGILDRAKKAKVDYPSAANIAFETPSPCS